MFKWLLLLAVLAWTFISWRWYTCGIKGACEINHATEVDRLTAKTGHDTKPVYFYPNEVKPVFGSTWKDYIDSIASRQPKEHQLVVTGWQFADEKNPQGDSSLALKRAVSIQNTISSYIPTKEITIRSEVLEDSLGKNTRSLEGVSLHYEARPAEEEIVIDNEKTTIHFPFGSTQRSEATETEAYLKDLAKTLQQKDVRVRIIGHTDYIGSSTANLVYGTKRAEHVRDILLSLGAPEDKINVQSEGETEPIADNRTPEGRKRNRRVEVFVEPL